MSSQEGAFTPEPGPPRKKSQLIFCFTSDGKNKKGRALGLTCTFKAAYLTDHNTSTSKDGIAKLAGNKPRCAQPVRTWLDDLGIDHKSNRCKFSCALCADGKTRDQKWDNITGHEDCKGHQKEEEKLAILAASRAQGFLIKKKGDFAPESHSA